LINAAEDLGTRQLNKNHAEFLAPLFSPQYLVPEQILGKCELRDVICFCKRSSLWGYAGNILPNK
jgi:hypothetical protein